MKTESDKIPLRRSVLFVPLTNKRAVAKAVQLDADVIILDMEDSVLAEQKQNARKALIDTCTSVDFAHRELLVRINAVTTPLWREDIRAAMQSKINGIVVPKVEHPRQITQLTNAMQDQGNKPAQLWPMIETPLGVVNSFAIAQATLVCALIVGTADLAMSMSVTYEPERRGLTSALSQIVLAARASNASVIDGVFMNIQDQKGLEIECNQGKVLGFDGKSLIHPNQLSVANHVFSPTSLELEHARRIIDAWNYGRDNDAGVCVLDNKLVEYLHVQQAQRLLNRQTLIQQVGY